MGNDGPYNKEALEAVEKELSKESKTKTKASSGGVGFLSLLAILFIALKLLDKIDWHWAWVLSPLWIPVTAILGVLLVLGVVLLVFLAGEAIVDKVRGNPKKKKEKK